MEGGREGLSSHKLQTHIDTWTHPHTYTLTQHTDGCTHTNLSDIKPPLRCDTERLKLFLFKNFDVAQYQLGHSKYLTSTGKSWSSKKHVSQHTIKAGKYYFYIIKCPLPHTVLHQVQYPSTYISATYAINMK